MARYHAPGGSSCLALQVGITLLNLQILSRAEPYPDDLILKPSSSSLAHCAQPIWLSKAAPPVKPDCGAFLSLLSFEWQAAGPLTMKPKM